MTSFVLKKPATALQYEHGSNEQGVSTLLRYAGRDGFSFTNASGFLKIYNGGLDLQVHDGQWIVVIGDSVTTMGADQLDDLFAHESPSNS